MKRTDAFGATIDNRYTAGNPATSVPATVVGESEMNNIQEEICNFIEAQGIALDGGDEEQLIEALNIFTGFAGNNFGQDFATTETLNFGMKAGLLRRGSSLISIAASITALTDNSTNSVYLDTTESSEAIAVVVGALPSESAIPLYDVITSSGGIVTITDKRTSIIDDVFTYEEGSWTPTNAGDATGVISNAFGKYTRSGSVVSVQFSLTTSVAFTAKILAGLPFTPKNASITLSSIHGIAMVINTETGDVAEAANIQDSSDTITLTNTPGSTATIRGFFTYITE